MFSVSPLLLKADNQHVRSLDGVRGLAILLVLALHLFEYFKWFGFGWMGVDLFFVLSGFLITGILLDSKDKPNNYRNFIVRRVLRIFPLYYLSLAFFFLILPFFNWTYLVPHFDYLYAHQNWFWLYVQNWLAATDGNWPLQNILSHFWSLAIEEQFYIVWPFLILFVPTKRIVVISFLMIAIALTLRVYFFFQGVHWTFIYVTTATHLDGLCLGAILACLIRREKSAAFLNRNGFAILFFSTLVLFIVLVIAGSFYINNPILYTIGYTVIALFFCAIVMVTISNHHHNFVRSIFEQAPLVFLGKYSYGIYIYHLPIYRILQIQLGNFFDSPVVLSIIALITTLILSFFSFHLFEAQFLKLKDKLTSH